MSHPHLSSPHEHVTSTSGETPQSGGAYQHRSPILQAIINVSMAAEFIRQQVDTAVAPLDITGVQYNILRVLKRVHPEGLSRTEVLKHLIEKSVDVTRSIDGLVETGLVERVRSNEDRRLSISKITAQGITALEKVDPYFFKMMSDMSASLTEDEYRELTRLCQKLTVSNEHLQ
jgi:DNA-binding MarR family transcriptional regulator